MLNIRPLTPADSIDDLTALLHRAYARLAAMGLNYTAVDQTPQVTRERMAGGTCYIATWHGALAGTIVVAPHDVEDECAYFAQPGVASAQQFAVDTPHQGRGIGRRLLERAEQWAREHGHREIALDTAEQATHLIALYTRLGYRPVSQVRRAGKVYRSIVFSKPLAG